MVGEPTDTMSTTGEVYDLAGAAHRILLEGADTGGTATVAEVTVMAGAAVPPHRDEREDLIWYVIGGSLEFQLPDGRRTVGAGATVFCPRGSAHGFVNPGSDAATALMLATPAGIEGFLRDAAVVLPAGVPSGPPPAEALAGFAEVAERHGITLEKATA